MPDFGWIPQPFFIWARSARYPFALAELTAPEVIEKELPVPDGLEKWYDQGATPQCVGYSCSWNQTINAKIHGMDKKFDAPWLFKECGGTKNGAMINWAMDVLRNKGHVEVIAGVDQPVDLQDGIQSYVWAGNYNDVRAAIDDNKPCVFGIPWYEEFMSPRTINGEYWIGSRSKWGGVLGGHAIVCRAASDKRQAVKFKNSWGAGYPEVWLSYANVDKLIKNLGGECAVALDRYVEPEPPPPEPEPDDTRTVNLVVGYTENSVTWSGVADVKLTKKE